jgi:hypothetical protein
MYPLATIFPPLQRFRGGRLPVSRDQAMLLLAAMNGLFMGLEYYLAHSISGTIRPNEWIPIVFGPAAGIVLLVAGWVALRHRHPAAIVGTLVFLASIAVGLLGAYFHWRRALLPAAPPGQQVSLPLVVWAPPILGPLFMSLVGVIGISALWREDPPDSGTLLLPAGRRLTLPYSKTRAYFFLVSLGVLATTISSVLDHARTGHDNPWLWVPVAAGAFGTAVALTLGLIERPSRADLTTYALAMVLLMVTGVLGSLLHLESDLVRGTALASERLIRGAPPIAPMLFADVGTIGLIVLLDPEER